MAAMNDHAPLLAQQGAKRARRLAQLEATLRDCARLLEDVGQDCEEARSIEKRIERVRREIERLRGIGNGVPARADKERDLLNQLSHWSGNVLDLAGSSGSGS